MKAGSRKPKSFDENPFLNSRLGIWRALFRKEPRGHFPGQGPEGEVSGPRSCPNDKALAAMVKAEDLRGSFP